MSILDNLLNFEENSSLYNYKFKYKNILMYPFIRFSLFYFASNEIHGLQNTNNVSFNVSFIQKIKYYLRSFIYKPFLYKNFDIIFFGSDIANIQKGKLFFNRLTETFANEYPSKTLLIETSDRLNFKRPRSYPNICTNDHINILSNIITKIKFKFISISSEDINQIDAFIAFLKQYINYEIKDLLIWDIIKNNLINISKKLYILNKEYIKLLKKLNPKILFLDCALYGDYNIPLLLAAKELNIPVGEYQHGLISLAHPAYNYSSKLPKCYNLYMPDFFMSYGEYWIKNSRIPIKKYIIGNPYLSETIKANNNFIKKEQILYISATIYPEKYVSDVIWLNNNLSVKGYSVIFRIHPQETSLLQTVYKPIIDNHIPIDTQPLYNTLEASKYIIGDYSTVIFEAALFNCIIFIFDNIKNKENVDTTQFNCISSITEIEEIILSENYKKTDPDNFWAENWRENYHKFIDSFIK